MNSVVIHSDLNTILDFTLDTESEQMTDGIGSDKNHFVQN
jgi:hypothetical protein